MVGNPVNLPIGWSMITGYLLGPGANLDGADLSGLVLERFDLAGARFVGADLSGTDLDGGDLTGAILVNAKVNGAALDATMTGVSSGGLIGQPLRLPAGWTTIAGYFVGPDADLQLADLRNTTLTGVKLDGANLSQAQLAGVVSGGITGTPQALPTGWHLLGGYLIGPGANLANANLSGVSLAGFNLNSVVFTNANLTGVSLAGSAVGNANFSGATGTPSGGSTAVYSATRCPDLTVTSAAQPTCVGHGFNP
jgi:uncharacterized protein YjbI with pentapeptide repeats